jgi:hypothetical protein
MIETCKKRRKIPIQLLPNAYRVVRGTGDGGLVWTSFTTPQTGLSTSLEGSEVCPWVNSGYVATFTVLEATY